MEELFRGIWVIAYRELLRFIQERSRMISSFAMPLLFLIVFGAGFNRVIGNLTPGVDFIKFIYPGIIAMTVLMSSVFSGLSVVWDREFGFLKEVLVAPLSRSGIVLGKAIGSAVISLGQGFVMLALAPILGVTLSLILVVELIPLLIVLSLSLSGLGILVASRMRSQQGFQVVVQLIIFPLIFLSGVFFPVNNVPTWLEVVSKINPLTYGVDAIRQLFLGGDLAATSAATGNGSYLVGVTVFGHTMSILEDVIVVAVLGAVLMLAAVWSFYRQE
ncbi:MAG TPA: ABC transporter permease [Dehalococcoidia bacterium]|jgi:ABC-2 type transport system permease protein|nr:ABC transporter permease [Dehalococcoidia bacterium]